jgi:hypothetical protein
MCTQVHAEDGSGIPAAEIVDFRSIDFEPVDQPWSINVEGKSLLIIFKVLVILGVPPDTELNINADEYGERMWVKMDAIEKRSS